MPYRRGGTGALLPPTSAPRLHERLAHSVAVWPGGGEHRWLLHVSTDVDHVRFRLTGSQMGAETHPLCVHAARSGARVRNAYVRGSTLLF